MIMMDVRQEVIRIFHQNYEKQKQILMRLLVAEWFLVPFKT